MLSTLLKISNLILKSLLVRLTLGLYDQDISKDERVILDELLSESIVVYEDSKYTIPSKYRAGIISLSQNSNAYLQILAATNVKDLFIAQEDLFGAKDGDLVIVQRLLGRKGTPSAKVIKIVGHAQTYSIALVKVVDGKKALVNLHTSHPSGVEITTQELNSYEEGTLFKIDNIQNIILDTLGNISDPKVDEKIVLAKYNKHDEFDQDILDLASTFGEVDATKYPKRKDLRDYPFCTIDPVTAKDFDDAIYYDEKNSTLYVAIADVSEYVKPFGPIDAEAIYRGFSIYLPHRSIPMLPRQLSETLCSLQPHKDRLSYVFEMKLADLEVVESKVYEAIIHSKRRFNYEEVDQYFNGELKPQNEDEREVFAYLKPLRTLTDALKAKRLQIGFNFRSLELEMNLDENGMIASTTLADETPSHALIEDCMLLANKAAASQYDRGVFRIHEQPSESKIQALYQELAGIGMFIEPRATFKETIEEIQKIAVDKNIESDVDTLIIQAQMRARYAPENVGHFGLGFERYTHFTSPIRRYSDLIVHRLLKAISANDTEEGSYVLRNIESLCVAISEKERESANIEIEFMQRKFARWAAEHIGKTFKARINKTQEYIDAEIIDEPRGAKVSIISTVPVLLFDKVLVRIESANIASAKITATVVEKLED